jgi:hypothetical protein
MTARPLEEWLDRLVATSRQRWALCAGATLSVTIASAVAGANSLDVSMWVAGIAALTAAIACALPASHWASTAITIVLIQWLSVVDDVTSISAPIVAACLFAFHCAIALMAVTPHGATVDVAIVRSWFRRAALVLTATTATWLLVVGLDQRAAEGNVVLAVAAVIVVAFGAVGFLDRSTR